MKDKIKNKIHKARLHVLTNERTQMILYAIAILFVIAIVSVLVISTINQQRAFLKYQVKSCYDKSEISSNESPVIKYATIGGNVVVSYEFEQKCYRKLDIEHTKGQDSINLYIITKDITENEDCICKSDVKAEIGPLDPKNYTININKKTDELTYLVNSRNITIE